MAARRQPRSPDPTSPGLEKPRLLQRRIRLQGTGTHLRHLPRLPPLRQPVRRLPHAVRPGGREQHPGSRRRRQEGLLEGGRPVLPVRPVLHDQVPVRAAARMERGLPAHHAARQGHQVQEGRRHLRREVPLGHRRARPLRRHPDRGAGGQRREPHQAGPHRHGTRARCGPQRLDAVPGHPEVPLRRGRSRPDSR